MSVIHHVFRSVPVKYTSGTTCLTSWSSCMNRRCTHQDSHCRCVGRKRLTMQLLWWSLREPVRTSAQRSISASQQQVHINHSTSTILWAWKSLNCLVDMRLTWHHSPAMWILVSASYYYFCRSAAVQSHFLKFEIPCALKKVWVMLHSIHVVLFHKKVHENSKNIVYHYKVIQERKIIKNERRCRNGVPKSTQTRKDKSDGKYTKLHPSLHLFPKE